MSHVWSQGVRDGVSECARVNLLRIAIRVGWCEVVSVEAQLRQICSEAVQLVGELLCLHLQEGERCRVWLSVKRASCDVRSWVSSNSISYLYFCKLLFPPLAASFIVKEKIYYMSWRNAENG